MASLLHDFSGQRFGRLTVVSRGETDAHWNTRWVCRCDCGAEVVVFRHHLVQGVTKSCGCLRKEVQFVVVHGHCREGGTTPTYRSWRSMWDRGARVCRRWASFAVFLEEMGERPPGTRLERVDLARGFEPGNCRWAPRAARLRSPSGPSHSAGTARRGAGKRAASS